MSRKINKCSGINTEHINVEMLGIKIQCFDWCLMWYIHYILGSILSFA